MAGCLAISMLTKSPKGWREVSGSDAKPMHSAEEGWLLWRPPVLAKHCINMSTAHAYKKHEVILHAKSLLRARVGELVKDLTRLLAWKPRRCGVNQENVWLPIQHVVKQRCWQGWVGRHATQMRIGCATEGRQRRDIADEIRAWPPEDAICMNGMSSKILGRRLCRGLIDRKPQELIYTGRTRTSCELGVVLGTDKTSAAMEVHPISRHQLAVLDVRIVFVSVYASMALEDL
ncbi:hypothetical protein LTR17_026713 [Elasticomyces elasticus]|nr:hypothetical protein LTR17_026713 [Elasticomyces elasticus]